METLKDFDFEFEYADASDISYKVLNKLNAIGLKPIKVHVRQKGISSKGDYMQCHANVKKIVQRYGGRRLIGQTISVHEDGDIETFNHSVWITKENKVVCVCKSIWDMKNHDKDYIVFIPRMIDENPNTIHEEKVHLDFVISNNKLVMIHPFATESTPHLKWVHLNNARQVINETQSFSLRKMMDLNIYLEDVSFIKRLIKKIQMVQKFGWKSWGVV